jgi:hypothetical protein
MSVSNKMVMVMVDLGSNDKTFVRSYKESRLDPATRRKRAFHVVSYLPFQMPSPRPILSSSKDTRHKWGKKKKKSKGPISHKQEIHLHRPDVTAHGHSFR